MFAANVNVQIEDQENFKQGGVLSLNSNVSVFWNFGQF